MTIVRVAALAAAALAAAAAAHAAPQAKKLYCWEEAGRKVCGDALPADAADNARTEFNAKTGTAVREVARALTAEERQAQAAADAEAARLAAEAEETLRRELAMVDAHATEDDLRRSYRNRMGLMDDKVQATRLAIASLRESLLSRLRLAAEQELAGKPVDEALAATIQEQHRTLLRQQAILSALQDDRTALDAALEAAVVRYRELKSAPSEG